MTTKTRGFGSIQDPEKRRQLASQGGTAAKNSKGTHRFTKEEAESARLKGLETRRKKAFKKKAVA